MSVLQAAIKWGEGLRFLVLKSLQLSSILAVLLNTTADAGDDNNEGAGLMRDTPLPFSSRRQSSESANQTCHTQTSAAKSSMRQPRLSSPEGLSMCYGDTWGRRSDVLLRGTNDIAPSSCSRALICILCKRRSRFRSTSAPSSLLIIPHETEG